MERMDREGIPSNRQATKYWVYFQGKKYPPKLLVSYAHEAAAGIPLASRVFTGGNETNGYLTRLGFPVQGEGIKNSKAFPPRLNTRKIAQKVLSEYQIRTSPDSFPDLSSNLLNLRPLYKFEEFNSVLGVPPATSGVYAWFFKIIPAEISSKTCFQREGLTLLYVGISPESSKSRQTLRDRLRFHYCSHAEGSTLRRTLGCLLEKEIGTVLRRVGSRKRMTFASKEQDLSRWMRENTLVTWLEINEPWHLEEYLLQNFSLPLNIRDNKRSPFYETLRRIRSQCCQRARMLPIVGE